MNDMTWTARANDTDLRVRNFINGCHVDCIGDTLITKLSPRDGHLLYKYGAGCGKDVDDAVNYARQAFNKCHWRAQSVHQRKVVLQRLIDLLEANKDEFALYECLDVGKPITQVLNHDIPMALALLKSCAESADKLLAPSGLDGSDFAFQLRKPVGVVGSIIGWNYPLVMAVMKMGPALAMGNSLVLKPSDFTALSASRLAALAVEAGVPPGVFNVVHGAGVTVGTTLSQHEDIDLLSFTGSSATGKQLMVAAGNSNMKRLMLECGGKSPYIVFEDCPEDLDFLAADIVETAFRNQGEWCSAGSRLLIQGSIKHKLLPKILAQAAKLEPQDPLNPDTVFGPLINEAHLNKVLGFIESGKQEGARLIQGGRRIQVAIDNAETQGYYLEPTIFDEVNSQHKIARDEIFGPVLSILTFDDEKEAISIANNSCYGLAAYAATQNLGRAQRLAQALNTGYLSIVGSSSLSGGGVDIAPEPQRQSGFGAETGLAGLASYTVSTAVHFYT